MKYPSSIAREFRAQTNSPLFTGDWETWTNRLKAFASKFYGPQGGLRFIKYHHQVFDKKGRFRYSDPKDDLHGEYYVWQDPDAGWRVFIRQRSAMPIQFEFFPGFDPAAAWANYIGQFQWLFDLLEVKRVMNS